LLGGGIGLLNGLVCHGALVWALDKPDKVFYWVWAAGFGYRLLFFALSFYVLIKTQLLPVAPTMLALVAGQFVVGVIPIKRKHRESRIEQRD
jgi:CHASE2 domain-containing sensor protein